MKYVDYLKKSSQAHLLPHTRLKKILDPQMKFSFISEEQTNSDTTDSLYTNLKLN